MTNKSNVYLERLCDFLLLETRNESIIWMKRSNKLRFVPIKFKGPVDDQEYWVEAVLKKEAESNYRLNTKDGNNSDFIDCKTYMPIFRLGKIVFKNRFDSQSYDLF